MELNDIWAFLHDEEQDWYFDSAMGQEKAYVFDTLGEPHGSFVLPGEDVAEHYYLRLMKMREQLSSGVTDDNDPQSPTQLPADTTAPLRRAIESMSELVANPPANEQDIDAIRIHSSSSDQGTPQ